MAKKEYPEYVKKNIEGLKPYQWVKGQSGNPAGRPVGKSMKEYAREHLRKMTEEERQEFMNGIDKEVIWKMAEGNPEQEVKGGITISDLINKFKDGDTNKNSTRDRDEFDEQDLEDEQSLQDSEQEEGESNIQEE